MTPSVWELLIALDMSTNQVVSYLDIRICIYWQGDILNLHLASIPVLDRYTGENMFNVSAKFFYYICQQWRNIIVGIVNYDARSMTGSIQGLATRFDKGVLPGRMWFWCGGHQMDLILQDFFKNFWMSSYI